MTASRKSGKRDVIPRWRRSREIAAFADSVSPKLAKSIDAKAGVVRSPMNVLDEYIVGRKPLVWAEAFGMALANRDFDEAMTIAGSGSAIELDRFPILQEATSASYIESIASHPRDGILNEKKKNYETSDLRSARRAVRVYESNPFAWLDLGRAYAVTGDLRRSERAVWTALHFDPDTRWVVRAAARCFVHCDDIESGIAAVEGAVGYKSDPWLVSAHLALSHSLGKTSPLMRRARNMFDDDQFRPKHLSELGMAIATVEASAAFTSRIVNRVAKRALRDPTENAIAQAEWIESVSGRKFGASAAANSVQNAFEARAKELEKAMEWRDAAEQTFYWLCDQPFSSRPAVDGSFIAATFLMDFELAEKFSEVGFRANPKDALVRNNYAVALASLGKVEKARRVFGSLGDPSGKDFEETYRATEGLLRYREGRLDSARQCYEESRIALEAAGDVRGAFLSTIFQALEERQAGNSLESMRLLTVGKEIVGRTHSPELATAFNDARLALEKMHGDARPGQTGSGSQG